MTSASAVQEREGSRYRAIPLPHEYEVGVRWGPDGAGVATAGERPAIAGGLPPQFGGRYDWWSPEHLLLSALGLCLTSTFRIFMAPQPFEVRGYASSVKGILEKTPGGIVFTSILIEVQFETASEWIEDAKRLLESAKHHCIVANSLKTPVDLRIVATGS